MEIRKSYTYLITFYDGSFYYGVRLCPKNKTPWQDTDYVGSPMTHKDKWNKVKFIKFILEVFDDYKIAQNKEKELIKDNLNNKFCLNENVGGIISLNSCIRGGKTQGKRNIESGHIKSIGKKNKESKHIKELGKTQGRKNVESGHLATIAKLGGKVTSAQKWKCLITGYVSTAPGLSNFQKKRKIDTKLRERVN